VFFKVYGRFRDYRKVREARRKNFHLVAPLKTSVARFYDQKNKKFTTINTTTIKTKFTTIYSFFIDFIP